MDRTQNNLADSLYMLGQHFGAHYVVNPNRMRSHCVILGAAAHAASFCDVPECVSLELKKVSASINMIEEIDSINARTRVVLNAGNKIDWEPFDMGMMMRDREGAHININFSPSLNIPEAQRPLKSDFKREKEIFGNLDGLDIDYFKILSWIYKCAKDSNISASEKID